MSPIKVVVALLLRATIMLNTKKSYAFSFHFDYFVSNTQHIIFSQGMTWGWGHK
jgi:hypothetical protein